MGIPPSPGQTTICSAWRRTALRGSRRRRPRGGLLLLGLAAEGPRIESAAAAVREGEKGRLGLGGLCVSLDGWMGGCWTAIRVEAVSVVSLAGWLKIFGAQIQSNMHGCVKARKFGRWNRASVLSKVFNGDSSSLGPQIGIALLDYALAERDDQ